MPASLRKNSSTKNLQAGAPGGGGGSTSVGWTFFNDPPPGAGGLNNNEYCFAELGTATRSGQATGVGNLAKAFGLPGELPMGAKITATANGQTITAVKRDRGYGQGGDGIHSDPKFAIDWWDGSAFGGKNPMSALGIGGGEGTVDVSYGGASSSGAGATASSGGSGPSSILDLLTSPIETIGGWLASIAVTLAKDAVLGVADVIIIPFWHWNQRAVAEYVKDLTGNELLWTGAFWGMGYVILFTDPNSKNLRPVSVRRSRLARHARHAQSLPARLSLVKPKRVKEKTPKKPKPVVSQATITQTGTMSATRSYPVKVTGTHVPETDQRETEAHVRKPTRSEVRVTSEGTLPTEGESRQHPQNRVPHSPDRTRSGSLRHRRETPKSRSKKG